MKIFHAKLFALLSSIIIWLIFGVFVVSPSSTHWSSLLVLFLLLFGGVIASLLYFSLELRCQRGTASKIVLSIGVIAFLVILTFIMIIPHPRNDIKVMLAILFLLMGILAGMFYVLMRMKKYVEILKKEKLGIIRLDNNQALRATLSDIIAGVIVMLAGGFLMYNLLISKTFVVLLDDHGMSF